MCREVPTVDGREGLGRHQRLRRHMDFLRCYRRGHKRYGAVAALHVHPNDKGEARLGVTASRKVGNSVVRHQAKRRVREVFRRWPQRGILAALDIVVHLKPDAGRASFQVLRLDLERLLSQLLARSGKR